jgi:hypothetical protein
MSAVTRALDRVFMPPAPAERLGVLRVLVGAYALVYLVVRSPHLISFATMDQHYFQPVGVAGLAPRPLLPAVVVTLVLLTLVFAAAFAFGYRYKITAPIFAGLQLWVLTYSNSFGMILHVDNMMCVQIIVLALSPAADALSLDARAGRVTALEGEQGRYGWALRLICILCVCAYLLAAIAKIENSGSGFVDDVTLRNYIAYDNVRKIELGSVYSPLGAWLLPYPGFFAMMAWLSLLLEALAPLALVHRRAGAAWAIMIWSFHFGVLLLMAIGFIYQLSFIAFAAFFRVEKILDHRWVQKLRTRFAAKPAPESEAVDS